MGGLLGLLRRRLRTEREHKVNLFTLKPFLILSVLRCGHKYVVRLQLPICVACGGDGNQTGLGFPCLHWCHAILHACLARLLELLGMAFLAMRMLVRIRIEGLGTVWTLVEHLASVRGHVLLEIDCLLELLGAHTAHMHTISIVYIALMTEHRTAIGGDFATDVAGAFLGGTIVPAHMLLQTVLVLVPRATDITLHLGLCNASVLQLMTLEGGASTYDLRTDVAHGPIIAVHHLDMRAEHGYIGKAAKRQEGKLFR